MKKTICIVFAIVSLAIVCLLCGCGAWKALGCEHQSDDWTVTLEPTCTEKGSKTGFCSLCEQNVTVSIDALGHDEVWHDGKPAESCSDVWWDDYFTCEKCGYSSYQENPPQHNADNQDLNCSKCVRKWGTIEFRKLNGAYEVASIGNFSGTKLRIPDTYQGLPVESIGAEAFRGCSGLTSITLPDSVTRIKDSALENCTGLTSFVIPNGVIMIGEDAFAGCTGLTSVTIPDSVKGIGYNAFYSCVALKSLTIPDSVIDISDHTFYGCTALESITLSNSITNIGYFTFYGCTSLKSIVIPEGVTSIGDSVFVGCSSLESITIPASAVSISQSALNNCVALTTITVKDGNPVYHSNGNCLIETASKTLLAGCKNSVIPSDGSVTIIGHNAFRDCGTLTSLVIPTGVRSIDTEAFRGCYGLTTLTISTDLKTISDSVFRGCQSLTTAYYEGTSDDRKRMTIENYNSELTAHFYYYSETEPTGSGKFWHYVDGVPTVW